MTTRRDEFSILPEPLTPADRDVARLDRALSRAAKRLPTPVGLEGRVLEASAPLLPARIAARLQPARPARRILAVRATVWGRLAMAASLGLAVLVAWPVVQQRHRPLTGEEVAVVGRVLDPTSAGVLEDAEFGPYASVGEHAWILTVGMDVDDLFGDVALMARQGGGG